MKKTITLILIMIIGLFTLTGCDGYNRQIVDLNYKYDKCITGVGDYEIEIEIDKWMDYEGEQIQIVGKDGKTYLVSSMNSILIREDK